ncbi:MAG: ATP-dependent Clp protease proteolytic subunit [Egibacteraceae bacterium]
MRLDQEERESPLTSMLEADVWKKLYENRELYLAGAIEDKVADTLAARLMSLDRDSDKDITLYIDSPGGLVSGLFVIYDTIHYLMQAKVNTVCLGIAASAAAVILATGTGTRTATPNARIMIHQPLGGARGQAADIQIQAQQIAFLRNRLNEILAERTGKPVNQIARDTDRDFWLSAPDAVTYGLIDEVLKRRSI